MSKSLSELTARRLRAIMGEEKVNSAELARRLTKSNPWVWRRVHGMTSLSMSDLDDIAIALGVPVKRLLPDEEMAA